MTSADNEVLRFAHSRLGQVLKAKYHLDQVLGVGGMGAVYAATHRNRMRFAIKVLHPEVSCVESIRARFLREGYVANSVNHPGAVAVLDDDIAEDGSAFLVMELLQGTSFEALWEASERALPLATLLSWLDQVLDVLVAAHEQGIVHRDLKPANLFLTETGQVKVLDFGIARLRDASGGGATQTGAALGTPAFMAPEQALGQTNQVDARTDLWALAATIFVLITGRLVHEGESPQQLLINSATRIAPALLSIAPTVPPAIAALVDRALAFSKEQRFGSALEMKQALALAYREVFGTDLPGGPRRSNPELARTELGTVERPVASAPSVYFAETRSPTNNKTNGSPVVHVASVASMTDRRGSPKLRLAAALLVALIVGSVFGVARYISSRAPAGPPLVSSSSEPAPTASSNPVKSSTLSVSSVGPMPSRVALGNQPDAPSSASGQRTVVAPVPAAPPARAPAQPPSALCARLLERQSLGETLTAADEGIFTRTCRK